MIACHVLLELGNNIILSLGRKSHNFGAIQVNEKIDWASIHIMEENGETI